MNPFVILWNGQGFIFKRVFHHAKFFIFTLRNENKILQDVKKSTQWGVPAQLSPG